MDKHPSNKQKRRTSNLPPTSLYSALISKETLIIDFLNVFQVPHQHVIMKVITAITVMVRNTVWTYQWSVIITMIVLIMVMKPYVLVNVILITVSITESVYFIIINSQSVGKSKDQYCAWFVDLRKWFIEVSFCFVFSNRFILIQACCNGFSFTFHTYSQLICMQNVWLQMNPVDQNTFGLFS